MTSYLRQLISLIPLVVVFVYWYRSYQARELRVRIMAITAAIGAFLGLSIHSVLLPVTNVSSSFTSEDLLTKLIISLLFGVTFLTWWPILGKGLKKVGITW